MLSKWLPSKTRRQTITLLAPLSGESVPISESPDEAFAQGQIGKGLAIRPSGGRLVAPLPGTVMHMIQTRHAVILEHESGLQILMHIGINTVALQGRGFTARVVTGERVEAGQTLIDFDVDLIHREGYSSITPIVIVNEELISGLDFRYGAVTAGESELMTIGYQR